MGHATFTLTITLGNDAMQSPEDLARALRETAATLDAGITAGRIVDDNGNRVGDFTKREW